MDLFVYGSVAEPFACGAGPASCTSHRLRGGLPALSLACFPRERAPHIKDHSIARLRERLAEAGERPYRADQIAAWLYRRGIEDPEQMTDLGAELRARLAREWQLSALEVERVDRSVDGTCKAALVARDGARIESVLIPEDDRMTLCVSTQVGCAMACDFCATGFMGFARNLRAAEIVDQVCRMRALAPAGSADQQRGVHGDGRAAVESRRGGRGDPPADRSEGVRDRAPARHGVDGRSRAEDRRAAGARAGQSRGVAARHDRRRARPPRAAEPPLSARGPARRAARAAHRDAAAAGVLRVHADRGRERQRSRTPTGCPVCSTASLRS